MSHHSSGAPLPDFVNDILNGTERTFLYHVPHKRQNSVSSIEQATPSRLSALNFVRIALWKDWKKEISSFQQTLSKENAEVRPMTSVLGGVSQPKTLVSGRGVGMQLLDK